MWILHRVIWFRYCDLNTCLSGQLRVNLYRLLLLSSSSSTPFIYIKARISHFQLSVIANSKWSLQTHPLRIIEFYSDDDLYVLIIVFPNAEKQKIIGMIIFIEKKTHKSIMSVDGRLNYPPTCVAKIDRTPD